MWHALVGVVGVLLIVVILVDGFESILQPRRVTRRYRWARLYYFTLWRCWRAVACKMTGRRQAAFMSVFGPLSLIGIFVSWFGGLILGFTLVNYGTRVALTAPEGPPTFGTYLYHSGSTFFTLGYGDVTPPGRGGRFLAVIEAGLGFGLFAATFSYLPALFQAYSRRELTLALLDARAGSPPTAAQLLRRMAHAGSLSSIDSFLADFERWSADLLESQLSFPVLGYYRSQHDNQSWLAALTTILDTCAFLMVQVEQINTFQAQVTFAIARHAAVDLGLIIRTPVTALNVDRLPREQLRELREKLAEAGVSLADATIAEAKLRELRGMYEPFVQGLAYRLLLMLPPFAAAQESPDNWQRSAWMRPAPGIGSLPLVKGDVDHFT